MDTKGEEMKFIKDQINDKGYQTVVIDVGVLGDLILKPDISSEKVVELAVFYNFQQLLNLR